ncbi:SURF1 family protein [compost metagenome]|jgi:surfeit locus 1 family protein
MTDKSVQTSGSVSKEAGPLFRSRTTLVVLAVIAAVLFTGLLALGTWQVYRLQWKLALIERVEQRVHAPATPAPGPAQWPQVSAANDEYRHVSVSGTYLYEQTVKTQAVTELGAGFWVLTPLRTADGNIFLINRGYIPERATPSSGAPGEVLTVSGLLRISEPGGGFLRHNDPAANRWYSRDVQAIAAQHKLAPVAPYFIDAAAGKLAKPATDPALTEPVGGLTVISFHNNHLVYALTWYALALMVAGAAFWLRREERKVRATRADRIDRETEDVGKNRSSSE